MRRFLSALAAVILVAVGAYLSIWSQEDQAEEDLRPKSLELSERENSAPVVFPETLDS